MSAVSLGFRPDHVTTASYALPQWQYAAQTQVDSFNNRLLLQLRHLPGVESVGLTSSLPTAGNGYTMTFTVKGFVDPRGPDQASAAPLVVIGDYFKAIGTPLLRGRYFQESDSPNSQLVAIVNREFAQHNWPSQNPIGKQMRLGGASSDTPWMTVVGEVADAKLGSPDAEATEQFYQTVAQLEKDNRQYALPTDLNGNGGYIAMRSTLPPEQMESLMRATVHSIDTQLPLTQVRTMDQVVAQSEAPRRFNTVIVSSFALAAVLLAVLGIYSIIAFSVAARAREMAIRMALGSQQSQIVRLVLTSGLKLAVVGCVLGLAGAAAASSLLRSFLFDVSPFDPAVMILTATAIFVLALVAAIVPARRAASVDPVQALRGE